MFKASPGAGVPLLSSPCISPYEEVKGVHMSIFIKICELPEKLVGVMISDWFFFQLLCNPVCKVWGTSTYDNLICCFEEFDLHDKF